MRIELDASGTPLQEESYYPFGLTQNLNGNTEPSGKNKYLYNGKELQDIYTWYDYGARFYDPTIGRWYSIDPKTEIFNHWSSYNYVADNPIKFIDPDGTILATRYIDPNGETIINTDDGSNDVVVVPWSRYNEFKQNASASKSTGHTNSIGWNNYWKSQFEVLMTGALLDILGFNDLSSEESKAKYIKYFITGDNQDFRNFYLTEIKAQWSDPFLVSNAILLTLDAGFTSYSRLSSHSYSEIVAEKYPGVVNEYSKQTKKQLEKTIRNTTKTIAEHEGYLLDPLSKSGMTRNKWLNMNTRARIGLLEKWQKDVERNRAYLQIAIDLLKLIN